MNLHRLDLVSLSLFSQVARSGGTSRGAALAPLAIGAARQRITDLSRRRSASRCSNAIRAASR